MLEPPSTDCNPYLRANSLSELLSWDDVEFVRCAYVTILGRQPDPDGEALNCGRIRRGHSKLEVLTQLRRSSEGLNHDPGISGLDRALRIARWERNSFLGFAVRAITRGEGDSASWHRHRALLNQTARIFGEQARQTRWIEDIDAKLKDLDATLSTLTGPSDAHDEAIPPLEPPNKFARGLAEPDPELGSRARHTLQLIELEAKAG